ncbi:MAG: FIST signal transduction protein [Candidatus Xenobia bacterium]
MTVTNMGLLFSTGFSELPEALTAGQEAARMALGANSADGVDLALMAASSVYATPFTLSAISGTAHPKAFIGVSTTGMWTRAGLAQNGIALALMRLPGTQVVSAGATGVSGNAEAVGRVLGETILKRAPAGLPPRLLVMFGSGARGDGEALIRGVRSLVQVPIVGGTSPGGSQFYNGQVGEDAVSAVMLCGSASVGVGTHCGFRPIGRTRRVTACRGNIIGQIDGAPAVRFYYDYLEESTPQVVSILSARYPVGFPTNRGFILRTAQGVGRSGELVLSGEVPSPDICLMMAEPTDVIEAVRTAATRAQEQLGAEPARALWIFTAVGHLQVLGPEAKREFEVALETVGSQVPAFGMHLAGQFGPAPGGVSHLHNNSVVVVALGSQEASA